MDVLKYNFNGNESEKETAFLFHEFGLICVALNWKMKTPEHQDEGEIDGIFYDDNNQFYLLYDDSVQQNDRQDKISKFLNKWKDSKNQTRVKLELNLKDYPLYIIYIDKSGKKSNIDSIDYILDKHTKVIYQEDFQYFSSVYKIIGNWAKNDFYNFLDIKPRKATKEKISATQIYVGNTPAYIFADRVENILGYSYISRRKKNSTGYQRMIDKRRVEKMSNLIKLQKIKSFPNSILLNCIDEINFIPKQKSECPCPVSFDLPNNFCSCKVVDGQHRLLAFSKLDATIQDSHSLPIVMFHQMTIENEIQTFIEINDEQKGIDPNLIYSLKSDLLFQYGTKEHLEKVSVEISRNLHKDAPLLKDNIFWGNAEEPKGKKITLTTIVQSLIEFRIVDFGNGFLQDNEQDFEKPYLTIKEMAIELISQDSSNIIFYKSNNGIKLFLKFVSLFQRNHQKNNITLGVKEGISALINSIKRNQSSLTKKYGKGGFNVLSNLIFNDLVAQNTTFASFEVDLKKLIK